MYNLCTVFIWFVIYGFIGWFYESIVLSIQNKKIIDTGFLTLPICPIYGFGALLCLLFLYTQEHSDLLSLFISSAVLCCVLEYFVSWLLEKLFNARWWDYSNYKFNINGRICLLGAVAFGILCSVLLKNIHPLIKGLVLKLPPIALYIVSAVIFAGIMLDLFNTVKTIIDLNAKLSQIQKVIDLEKEKSKQKIDSIRQALQETASDIRERIGDYSMEIKELTPSISSIKFTGKIKSFIEHRKFSERRILRAFPTLKSIKYIDAFERIKNISKKNDKK